MFGTPAETAGRKKPVASPATSASPTISDAFVANGSRQNTIARRTSAATIRFRRRKRSSSGPSVKPTTIDGRKSTSSTAPTQRPESVRSLTSIVSAIAARNVPTLEPSVDRNSNRKPAPRSGASCLEVRPGNAAPRVTRGFRLRGDAGKHVSERGAEELELLRRADRHANRLGCPEPGERPYDHALLQQLLEERLPVADLDVDEVAERGHRLEPVLAQDRLELRAAGGIERPPRCELLVLADARERGDLRGRGDVERAPHLVGRLDDVRRRDAVADARTREAVDLREGAKHDDVAAGRVELRDRVRVVGIGDVLEVRLIDHDERLRRDALDERAQLRAAVRCSGRVVRMADVDELRPRADRVEERVEVVRMVAQRHPLRRCAELDRVEHVARERRPAADDLVAGLERRLREQVDDAVRARADDDLSHVDAVALGERRPERVGASVGIAVQLEREALHRLERRRERRERPLVRRELDDALEAELPLDLLDRLAGLIRDEPGDRLAEAARHSSPPRLRRQKKSTPAIAATIPAAAPPCRALGTASAAFFRTTRLPTLTATQPTSAFRLFTIPMWPPFAVRGR